MKHFLVSLAFTVIAVFFSASNAYAQTIDYVVQPGDTISSISERFLGGYARWGAIEKLNPGLDIHKLRPGLVLHLPENRVSSVMASVKVLKINGYAESDGAVLKEGQRLGTDAVVIVGEDSFMTLALDDGSIVIVEPGSTVHVHDLRKFATGAQRVIFEVEDGRVEVEAVPQKPGARFEISTPTATTAVRGTRFRTAYGKGEAATTEVVDGHVDVFSSDKKRHRVKNGEGIVITPAGSAAQEILLPEPDLSGVAERFTRTTVELSFPKIDQAGAYRVSVARDAEFRDVIATVIHESPDIRIASLDDGRYYMRARAISQSGLNGRDAQRSFELDARPEPPFILEPPPGKHLTANMPVQLSWSVPQSAQSYVVDIEKDGMAFSRINDLQPNQYSFTAASGNYRWRLATHNENETGPFGDWSSFIVVTPPQGPEAEVNLGDETTLTLVWPGNPGDVYHWQLASDAEFHDNTLIDEGTATTPEIVLPKPEGGTYYVRVRTINSKGIEGTYGNIQKFDIPKKEPSPLWMLLLALPFAFL